ncbi:L-alanine exporter AlaE [Candidatus Woesearchaeota archaeon]|nr:L-alanine exporter AlaE [Candidatus Woesearchaeota archaeon]
MSLEDKIKFLKEKWLETTVKFADNNFYKYSVDVVSGWVYYTPTYALQEAIVGKDLDTIVKTRALGLLAHAIAMRPMGLLRNYVANKWNVTKKSPLKDKIKVNLVAITPIQSIVYAGMISGGMVWSGKYDLKSSIYAWCVGVGLGALHAIPYGFVQDAARNIFGIKPAIKK